MASPFTYTCIRQNYQNSALSTRGINMANILGNPTNSALFFHLVLGSGPMANRIYSFYKTHPREPL